MAVSTVKTKGTPESQLRAYIGKFDPKLQKLIRSVRSALRKRLPAANEMVYDYGSSLVISYSPTDRGFEGIVSTAARADGVRLYFNNANKLRDPKKLLAGTGTKVRFIRVETDKQLAHPDVEALIAASIEHAAVPLPASGRGRILMRTPAKARPRRKTK